MTCCVAGDGGRRQISADWQKDKLGQQLVLLMAMVMVTKQPKVVVVLRTGLAHVSFALKGIVTPSSRPVGICARAMTAQLV